eukprot:SAG31_NODE_11247_length_1050_cov_1.173502_2_plen_55_part_00
MGSPAVPSAEQIAQLIKVSEVKPTMLTVVDGAVAIDMGSNSAVVLVFESEGHGN